MTSELKPCPFCGGDVRFYSKDNQICGNGTMDIFCDSCETQMTEHYILDVYVENKKDSYKNTKDRLFLTWNTRKSIPIAELEAFMESKVTTHRFSEGFGIVHETNWYSESDLQALIDKYKL